MLSHRPNSSNANMSAEESGFVSVGDEQFYLLTRLFSDLYFYKNNLWSKQNQGHYKQIWENGFFLLESVLKYPHINMAPT